MNLKLYQKCVKLQNINNIVMPEPDLPKGTGWHLQTKSVIPDLIGSSKRCSGTFLCIG